MRTALLCLTVMLLAAAVCQAIGPGSCECLKTSNTVLRISNIKSYYVQKSDLCPSDAVVFTTVKRVKICSDQQKPWVKRAMKAVDGRRTTVSSKAIPATTAFSPTWNTADSDSSLMTSVVSSIHHSSGSTSDSDSSLMTSVVSSIHHSSGSTSDSDSSLMTSVVSSIHHSSGSTSGQCLSEDTFQTLETATDMMASLFRETYCLQKTED